MVEMKSNTTAAWIQSSRHVSLVGRPKKHLSTLGEKRALLRHAFRQSQGRESIKRFWTQNLSKWKVDLELFGLTGSIEVVEIPGRKEAAASRSGRRRKHLQPRELRGSRQADL